MKQFTKYICVFLMMAGMSVSAWGTTTSSAVILPAGSTSYTAGDWGDHGAYIGSYPTSAATESMCVSDGNGYDVTFYQAYDAGTSDGLQLKRKADAYVSLTIASSKGIDVEISYKNPDTGDGNGFTLELTGASNENVAGSASFTTTTISTSSTSATLKINGSNSVLYIKYIKITPKSSGTITIGHDDCVLGPNIVFSTTSISKTVTPAEAESGGSFTSIGVTGINIYGDGACWENWVQYDFENTSGASGTYGTDWEFSYVASSSSDYYSCPEADGSLDETVTISYAFLSEPDPGDYTADFYALTWDDEYTQFDFRKVTVTLTVEDACTDPTVEFSSSTVYKAKNASSFTKTATAKDGGSDTNQTITYTSSNTDVATVNSSTGAVTIKTDVIGSTVITATAAANSTYCEGTASYTLYVYTNPTVNQTHFTGVSRTPTSLTAKGGQISDKGGLDIQAYGYVVGTSTSVDWDSKVASAGQNGDPGLNTDFGTFTTTTDLTPGTHYYVRVFAYNGKAFGYSTYGEFTTPYLITLNKNGGDTNGSAYVLPDGTTLTNISEPTREHYTVEGYYTTSGMTTKIATDEGALQASVEVSSTTWTNGSSQWKRGAGETFYAKWTPVDYTISFNSNGGSGSMSSTDKAYNSSYSLPSCTFTPPSGKVFDHWGAGSAGGTSYDVDDLYTVTGDITFYAVWKDGTPTDLVFSCAELEITGPTGNLVFITSAASKTVRSQEAFHIEGSGLSASQSITFTHSNSTIASKFAYKTSDGTALSTDASGEIDTDFYIYYTPDAGDTDDGLDVFTNLQAKVTEGLKPKASNILSTKTVMGRHLPAEFVIAGKKNNKWYAMPANMSSTTNPKPSEIAVDDIDDPSIAYTATSNIYSLEGPTASNISGEKGDYIRFVMTPLWVDDADHSKGHAPLFGNSTGSNDIGKSGNSQATSDLPSGGWWWKLVQTNMSITNPQDAKYTIYNHNNTSSLSLRDNAGNPDWGLFASGVEELRLIPASDIVFTEAYFVEWAQHGGVVEVDAQGISATSVIAHLGEESSSAITLVQTKASDAKNKNSKYNYTVNFGDGIDFADAASNGAMLTLEWKNGATVKAMSNIVIPKIVASNITINKTNYPLKSDWNTEVHVLPGKTVTIDADYSPNPDVTIKELNIYPGATVVASTGTLIATTLVLRNGWSRAGTKKYDVARLHVTSSTATLKATNVYADWYIDYDQYYPIAVPWNATVENFDYRYCTVDPSVGPSGNIRMRYYDGNSRAINVQEGVGSGANWKQYGEGGNKPVPTTLTPSTGYAMTAKRPTGKAFSIIRMPLTLPSGTWGEGSWTTSGESGAVSETHKDQVDVTAYNSGSTPGYAQGWNFIANPYMSLYQGAITLTPEVGDAITINVVNIPDVDFKEYGQYATATTKLKPASGFLIQTPKDGTITFGTANRKASAPSYRKEVQTETRPEQQVYIVLNDEKAEDMMGLFVSEQYTAEYDLNGDVEKLLSDGNTLRTYMRYGDMNMAYVAINETLAKEWIPVNVRIPEAGEYTYSMHEASIAGELEGVYLIDYQNGDKITNLIEQSYTFSSTAGTINGRFAINAKVGERQTPTDIDVVNVGGELNSDKPFKFIYREKVYIYHRGVIYDATGKRVREINK